LTSPTTAHVFMLHTSWLWLG
jgi:hypothetical protein